MSDTAGNGFVGDLRAGYTRLFSGNWVVPVFVAAWVVIVILPLLVMIAHSFFEMKNYQVSYDASFKTWNSLIDSRALDRGGAHAPRRAHDHGRRVP